MILLINACVRKESRTKRLADRLLAEKKQAVTEIRLEEIRFPLVNETFLTQRDRLIASGRFDDPLFALARQFAEADEIVIAAPFWDLSFPAALKQYFEQINVLGITFRYTPQGVPMGLCKAEKLTFVTTAGGDFFPEEYGFGYIKALAENFYGIKTVKLIKATGLDIDGRDPDAILETKSKTPTVKLTELDLDRIKVAIFDFDQTLAIHKDKEYTRHRDESEESFANFFIRAYTQPEGFYDTVEPCERSEPLYSLICELRARGVKLYCLSGMKYSFHFEAKKAFVWEHYGEDIEMLFAASQERKLECAKVLAKMNGCELHNLLFVDDRSDVIDLMKENGVQTILAD